MREEGREREGEGGREREGRRERERERERGRGREGGREGAGREREGGKERERVLFLHTNALTLISAQNSGRRSTQFSGRPREKMSSVVV